MKILKTILKKIGIYKILLNIPYLKEKKRKYGLKINRDRKEAFDKFAYDCLKKVKNTMDENDITFWLDFGTLLGAIRENDFIEHDLDLDFGIDFSSNPQFVKEVFEKNGVSILKEFILDGQVVEQTYSYKGVTFDIFFYFRDKNNMWTYCFTKRDVKSKNITIDNIIYNIGFKSFKVVMKNRYTKKIIFKGESFDVPENTEEYLIENYGPNYMTPIKDWDFVNSPSNMYEIENKYVIEVIRSNFN